MMKYIDTMTSEYISRQRLLYRPHPDIKCPLNLIHFPGSVDY
jgi:hypothetical protein